MVQSTSNKFEENLFSKKLRDNRDAYLKLQQHTSAGGANGGFVRSQSITMMNSGAGKVSEFSTAGCSDINDYIQGRQIGHGAYAVVKECTHRPTN